MGILLSASCKCGYYKENLLFGAGMCNFETECNVPAIKNGTNELVMRNIFRKEENSDYIFYSDSLFHQPIAEDESTLDFGNVSLAKTGNFCPKCTDFQMDFLMLGFFD